MHTWFCLRNRIWHHGGEFAANHFKEYFVASSPHHTHLLIMASSSGAIIWWWEQPTACSRRRKSRACSMGRRSWRRRTFSTGQCPWELVGGYCMNCGCGVQHQFSTYAPSSAWLMSRMLAHTCRSWKTQAHDIRGLWSWFNGISSIQPDNQAHPHLTRCGVRWRGEVMLGLWQDR
jgi:hypothetical protein